MNKVILTGRLTADPELRQTPSGISSCRFSVAVTRKYKNQQTGEFDSDFITCIAWRQTAEFVSRYFSKGRMIVVEGVLRNNNYKDKKYPDVTHYVTDVMVENVEFAGDKARSDSAGSSSPMVEPEKPKENEQLSYGNLSDFEEILSDGDVPF